MPGSIVVTPNPVPEGCPVKITVTDGTPSTTVAVTIRNGQSGASDTVTVQLDSQGNGSTTWTVPNGWANNGTASFDSPGFVGDSIIVTENTGQECPEI